MPPRRILLLLAVLTRLPASSAEEPPAFRYPAVTIEPARTSVYIGSVSLTVPTLAHIGHAYASTYVAKVFPFFFYSEAGRLWIDFSADGFARLARGETVEFTGHAQAEDGAERKIEGRVTRADATGGKIKVRVFVSKRIELIFNTTYRFEKN